MRNPFIYAETAFHHEGDIEFLLKLIDEAHVAGAEGIKFQVLLNVHELLSTRNPGYPAVKNYVFSDSQWQQIFDYALKKSLALIVMPLDLASFELVAKYKKDIRYLELHSVSYNDVSVKQRMKSTDIDLILGVGGRTQEEIRDALKFFGKQLTVLMTGFQSFPSSVEDIRLRKIKELVIEFPSAEIGYADHSSFDDIWGIDSNLIACTLGATIFEKHLTIQEGQKRVDYESAVGVVKFRQIVEKLKKLTTILHGYENAFEMTPAELTYRNRQKVLVASRNLTAGTVVSSTDLVLKMTGAATGLFKPEELIGKILKRDINVDELIQEQDVNY